jgi:hypothetical protein
MKTIFQTAFQNGISYQEYRDLVTNLVKEGKVTGATQSADLVHYTELNEARMHRLDKTITIIDEVKSFLENSNKNYIWLVITEGWCGDAAQILPVINKMAELSNHINLKIVLRDDNEDLMNLFLTNGTKSIPKLIIIDEATFEVIADFGPRPTEAKNLVLDYKKEHGVIDETIKIDLQKWYLQDKGISTQKEIIALM